MAANRDPDHYRDPDTFDLHRHADDHLSFGLGKHFCLGYEMARAEAVIGSELLLDAFPRLALRDGVSTDMVITGQTRSLPSLIVDC